MSPQNDPIGYGSLSERQTPAEGSEQSNSPATNVEGSRLKTIFERVRSRLGLVLAIIAVMFFSFHSLCVDFLTAELNEFQIAVMSFPVPLVGCLFLIVCKRIAPGKKIKVMLFNLSGGVSLFSRMCCITFSYEYIPLGDAVAISYVSLILVGIVSWILLRETLRLLDFFLAFIAFAGVVCIARPPFIFGSIDDEPSQSNTLLGTAFGIGTALATSVFMVSVRKLSQLGEHFLMTAFINDFIVVLLNGIICLAWGQWQRADLTNWLWCLGGGTTFFAGQILLYNALSTESATLVNIVNTIQIVISFLLEYVFFHIVPSWTSAVGGVLIMLASVGAVTRKPVENEQQT